MKKQLKYAVLIGFLMVLVLVGNVFAQEAVPPSPTPAPLPKMSVGSCAVTSPQDEATAEQIRRLERLQ